MFGNIYTIRTHDDRILESKLPELLGLALGGRVKCHGTFKILVLVQPPGDALLEPLLLKRPGFEHASWRHHIRHAGLTARDADLVQLRMPDAVNVDKVELLDCLS